MLTGISFAGSAYSRQQMLSFRIQAATPLSSRWKACQALASLSPLCSLKNPKKMMQVGPFLDPFSWSSATPQSSPQQLTSAVFRASRNFLALPALIPPNQSPSQGCMAP